MLLVLDMDKYWKSLKKSGAALICVILAKGVLNTMIVKEKL